MGIVHTPRVLFSIAKGLWARHGGRASAVSASASASEASDSSPKTIVGVGANNNHTYMARAGPFDVDYLGHLNNAAYFSHAEYARWEWTAQNGILPVMAGAGVNFVVASTTIRYRREIRPVFRQFSIDSNMVALDETSVWILQNFRYPIEGRNRVRAQMILKGAITQVGKKGVLDPRIFFRDMCGFDEGLIDEISSDTSDSTVSEMLQRYTKLEDTIKLAASEDDETHTGL